MNVLEKYLVEYEIPFQKYEDRNTRSIQLTVNNTSCLFRQSKWCANETITRIGDYEQKYLSQKRMIVLLERLREEEKND